MASGCGGGVLSAVATGSVSHPVTRSPVLVGRAAELAMARGLVDGLAAGRGAVLLVAGEAGIGKTRLLDEVAARAADGGLTVLSGRAVQGGGTFRAVAGAVLVLDDPAHAAHPTLRGYRTALGRLLPSWAEPGKGASPGLDASPGGWNTVRDATVKLFAPRVEVHAGEPGVVLEVDADVGILIGAGHEAVRVREVQPEGKRRMTAGDWLRGRGIQAGDRLQ